MLTQLFEGELSGNIYNNIFAPERLAPGERKTYVDYIKSAVNDDRNPFVDWVVDVVTDPMILLAVGLTPGAASGLAKGVGRGIMSPINTNFVREKVPWLASIGLLTGQQQLRNAPQLVEAMLGIRNIQKGMLEANAAILAPARENLLKKLQKINPRIKHLDPQRYREGTKERELLNEVMDVVHGRLSGLDESTRWFAKTYRRSAVAKTYRIVEEGDGTVTRTLVDTNELSEKTANKVIDSWKSGRGLKEGEHFSEGRRVWHEGDVRYVEEIHMTGNTPELIEIAEKPLMSSNYTKRIIEKYGLQDYIAANREVLDGNFLQLFGKDTARRWGTASKAMEAYRAGKIKIDELIDVDKVLRIFRGKALKIARGDGNLSNAEKFLEGFFSNSVDDILKAVKNEDALKQEIYQIFTGQLMRKNYFPTSATQLLDETGRPLQKFRSRISKGKEVLSPMGATLQRTHSSRGNYGMDFYERLEKAAVAEGDPRLLSNLKKKKEYLEKKTGEAFENREVALFGGVTGINPNVERTMTKYLNQSAQTYAMYVAGTKRVGDVFVYEPRVWKWVSDGQRKFSGNLNEVDRNAPLYDTSVGTLEETGEHVTTLGTVMEEATSTPLGGYSLADVLEQGYVAAGNNFDRATIKDILIPAMLGRKTLEETTENSLMMFLKKQTDGFVKTDLAKYIQKKGGGLGQKLIDDMASWSAAENIGMHKGALTGQTTKYLYATHLGFNPASVMLNLTQPLLFTSSFVGARDTLKAYGQAFKEMNRYFKNRKALVGKSVMITPQQREQLIQSSFKHADSLGIKPDIYENLDALTEMGRSALPRVGSYSFFDFPLKGFEKGEWFNRIVTAHAVENAYKRAARKGFFPASAMEEGGELHGQMLRDTRAIVAETQFGSGFLNTPTVFMEQFSGLPGAAGAGRGAVGFSMFLSNPLIRQFLQFPTRALTSFAYTPSQIAGGTRTAFGRDMSLGPVGAAVFDAMRGLGMSALVSHSAKDLMGINMERGLYPEAVGAIPKMVRGTVTGEEYERFNPPVIDLARHGISFLTSGDVASLQQFAPRLMPGGITLQRLLGVSRDQSSGLLGDLTSKFQKTYVDWDNPTSNGHVPMFKGDGTLIGYEDPFGLLLSGLGLDMGSLKKSQSELSHYLSAQRDLMVSQRREYLSALFANNMTKAKEISEDFQNKFDIPLTVNKRQIDAYSKNRIISRDERILDRMPTESRTMFAKLVASRPERAGLPAEAFEKPTATQRSKVAQRPELHLDPQVLTKLRELVDEEKRRKGKTGPFDPYNPPFLGGS
jgi:hypothetical protein